MPESQGSCGGIAKTSGPASDTEMTALGCFRRFGKPLAADGGRHDDPCSR